MDIDFLSDDSALQAILGRSDLVTGIDNDGIDFSQLESYINENIDDGPPEFTDGLSGTDASKFGTETETGPTRGGLPTGFLSCKTGSATQAHLPDSPPDSGSEPPFSPQDHPSQLHSPHQKPLSGHLTDLTESQRSYLMGTGRGPAPIQYSGGQTLGQTQLPPPGMAAQMAMPGLGQMPMPQYAPPQPPQHPPMPHPTPAPMPAYSPPQPAYSPPQPPAAAAPTKKRKLSASELLSVPIKQEPGGSPGGAGGSRGPPPPGHPPPPLPPIVTQCTLEEDDYTFDVSCGGDVGGYMDPAYQCIRFTAFQQNVWHQTCDANLKELQTPYFKVDADKGFNYSNSDEAFVCQKKNHFQITCHIHQPLSRPHYVKTQDGLKKIDAIVVNFFGVKTESPNQCIKVEQSQSDRTKRCYKPVVVELNPEQTVKITVGRLHFSETTTNNMRKKGKPNPDQRFFFLVVSLQAAVGETRYPLIQYATERIIVRASNPGQFESDVELCWQKGQTQDSTYHVGRVGVNTDKPDEALVVHGNLKLTGHVMNPSDRRVKDDIEELDTKEQLNNVQKLRVVKYNYVSEFADSVGLEEAADTGVIAQEVQRIIPDAVRPAGDVTLASGRTVDNFLVVNKERIFMENIGAVKELCKVTGTLENRIEELERMNRRLAKLKRHGSFKSTSSVSTVTSRASSFLSSSQFHKRKSRPPPSILQNRLVQGGVCVLVLVMLFCLIAMGTLYIMEWQKRQDLIANMTQPADHAGHRLPNGTYLPLPFAANSSNTSEPLPPQGHVASVPYSLVPETTAAPPPAPPPPPLGKEDRTVVEHGTSHLPAGGLMTEMPIVDVITAPADGESAAGGGGGNAAPAPGYSVSEGGAPSAANAIGDGDAGGDGDADAGSTANEVDTADAGDGRSGERTAIHVPAANDTDATTTEAPAPVPTGPSTWYVSSASTASAAPPSVAALSGSTEAPKETSPRSSTEKPLAAVNATTETAAELDRRGALDKKGSEAEDVSVEHADVSRLPDGESPATTTGAPAEWEATTAPSATTLDDGTTVGASSTSTPTPASSSPAPTTTPSPPTTRKGPKRCSTAVRRHSTAAPATAAPGAATTLKEDDATEPAAATVAGPAETTTPAPAAVPVGPPVIGAEESCRAGQRDSCPTICCLPPSLSEFDRSQQEIQNTSVVSLDEMDAPRMQPTSSMTDVEENQIGYSASSGSDGSVKRDPDGYQSEEEMRASSRYSSTRRMRYPAVPGDMANDALTGTAGDWSKRKVEKKTPTTRRQSWPFSRRSHRRRARVGRSTQQGFGYVEQLRLREYPDVAIDRRYCAPGVPDYDNCVNNIGGNFTFYIPVSKHMTRPILHLEMIYSELHALAPAPVQCRLQPARPPESCVEQTAADHRRRLQQPTRNGSEAGRPVFLIPLDAGRWRYRSYTFRIAAKYFPGLNPCRVTGTFIKSHFYEYNVIFERQCDA